MEFQENQNQPNPNQSENQHAIPGLPPANPRYERKRRSIWRLFWSIILALSVIANIVFFLIVIGLIAFVVTGQSVGLIEEVVREGPMNTKIAIVSIDGVIYDQQADSVYKQFKSAQKDNDVKAVILRVNSPGGTISASDRIYNEILKFKKDTNKPIIAFMQGTAASGGYYTSVACDHIIAEPTTVTGSIGVISSYLVLQELLEEKLGVLPVTIKSGERKDWPSNLRAPSTEEIQYIEEKLIQPYLERFINIVADGRKDSLTLDQVRTLADGSIFAAPEALEENLIDQIGYLDEAIDMVKSLAQISQAQVIQYRRPFSLNSLLGYEAKNSIKIDRNILHELSTFEFMYLWSLY